MIFGTFAGIPDSWEYIIKEIWLRGETNKTEYGLKSKFHNGLLVEMTDLKPGWSPHDPYCSKNRVEEYKNQFVRGYTARRVAEAKTDRDKGLAAFKYTYMDRLAEHPILAMTDGYKFAHEERFDQMKWLRDQLLSGRVESRRMQAVTWVVELDCDAKNEDPPCLQRIWVYPRTDKTLDVHINYRSWDMFKGYPANINAIYWMLQEELLKPTGYKLRAFRAMGDNVHVYEDDYEDVERMAKALWWR